MKLKRRSGVYRRADGAFLWHSETACPNMPKTNYIEKRRPVDGELCDVCVSIEQARRREK